MHDALNAALIWADEADRISITGTGAIDGNGTCFVKPVEGVAGKKWKFERIGGFDQSPPRVVFFAGCRDVTLHPALTSSFQSDTSVCRCSNFSPLSVPVLLLQNLLPPP